MKLYKIAVRGTRGKEVYLNMETIKEKIIAEISKTDYDTRRGLWFSECNLGSEHQLYFTLSDPDGKQDGMQLTYTKETGMYEVAETQAGENQDKMYIYTDTKRVDVAVKSLVKGNVKRKPIKIWD